MRLKPLKISSIVLTLFGLVTLFISGSVIFDLFGIRAKEGNYVLFIVITNFACGFFYLIAAYGLFLERKWTKKLLLGITTVLIFAFIGLLWHIRKGGIYEEQTVKAMIFRTLVTILFFVVSSRYFSKRGIK